MKRNLLVCWMLLLLLNISCPVMMAAKQEGIELEEILPCKTKTCFLSKGPEVIDKGVDDMGYYEVYKYKKKQDR